MSNWNSELPDWMDDGKEIKVRYDTQEELVGILYYDDFDSDEEGDEWPIWRIRMKDGKTYSIFDFSEWTLS